MRTQTATLPSMPQVYNLTLEAWKILPLDAIACMMLPGDKIGTLSD